MPSRSETIHVRNAATRYLRDRASVEDMRAVVLESARSMRADGLTMEQILVVLKGAITLAASHVGLSSAAESVSSLRAQMAPWLVSIYIGDGDDSPGDSRDESDDESGVGNDPDDGPPSDS